MPTRSNLLAALLSFGILGFGCNDDAPPADAGPAICEEETGLPIYDLDPFEPCEADEQCQFGVCRFGFCAEPCETDDDCISFAGDGDRAPICFPQDAWRSGCVYFCSSVLDCPATVDTCEYKVFNEAGPFDYVCQVKEPCT